MDKVLIVFGAIATLAVGMLVAEQATSRENQPPDTYFTWMHGLNDDTTPCREASPRGYAGGPSHTEWIYPLAEACRQEWRRAHNTYLIPDSYRGPSKRPRGGGSWR